jgi:hypothetical protein
VYWYLSLLVEHVPTGRRNPAAIAARETLSFESPFRAIVAATESNAVRFDELLQRPPLARWGEGRVTLLGDAAHSCPTRGKAPLRRSKMPSRWVSRCRERRTSQRRSISTSAFDPDGRDALFESVRTLRGSRPRRIHSSRCSVRCCSA